MDESGPAVFQPKWCPLEDVCDILEYESCVFLVVGMYRYLPVRGLEVGFREPFGPPNPFNTSSTRGGRSYRGIVRELSFLASKHSLIWPSFFLTTMRGLRYCVGAFLMMPSSIISRTAFLTSARYAKGALYTRPLNAASFINLIRKK